MLTHNQISSGTPSATPTKISQNQSEESSLKNESINPESTQKSLTTEPRQSLVSSQVDQLSAQINPQVNTSTTILIVDDTPNNLQILFSYLETAGFKVLLAEDSESALQIAQSQNPDLILLDVLMPGVDGFATCSQLKSQAATKDIPVIFLTALSDTINKVLSWVA